MSNFKNELHILILNFIKHSHFTHIDLYVLLIKIRKRWYYYNYFPQNKMYSSKYCLPLHVNLTCKFTIYNLNLHVNSHNGEMHIVLVCVLVM